MKIKYTNLIDGSNVKNELDETTGLFNKIIIDTNKSDQNLSNMKPSIEIINNDFSNLSDDELLKKINGAKNIIKKNYFFAYAICENNLLTNIDH